MRIVAKQLLKYDKSDTSLQEAVDEYTKRWQVLTSDIDRVRVELEQVPERWRAYNQRCVRVWIDNKGAAEVIFRDSLFLIRLEHFVEWMNGVEDAIADLDKESVSFEQYKETLSKFEVSRTSKLT